MVSMKVWEIRPARRDLGQQSLHMFLLNAAGADAGQEAAEEAEREPGGECGFMHVSM